jgi:tetratricopeptide (TPR) repeat protein
MKRAWGHGYVDYNREVRPAFVAIALMAGTAVASAQSGIGRAYGNVRDVDGNPIKGATVTAENDEASPRSITTTTDEKGRFSMLGLRRGTWKFMVQAPGFEAVGGGAPIQTLRPNPPMTFTLARTPDPGPPSALSGVDVKALQTRLDGAAALAQARLYDDAIAAYEGIARQMPALTSVYLQLGWLHTQRKDSAKAIAAYEQLIAAGPESPEAGRARALVAALRAK